MDNAYKFADKFADKWTYEKVANQQTFGNAGGSAGSRTPDHLIKSQMLYQLSYRPACGGLLKGTKKAINVNYIEFASKKNLILFKYSHKIISDFFK